MAEKKYNVSAKPFTFKNIVLIIVGSVLYAGSVNLFLLPLNLFAGGIPGLSQVVRTLFFTQVTQFDVAGLINFVFNVLLFILAYTGMNKKMLVGTAISVCIQTIVFTFVPVPPSPILTDILACILIAGIVGGLGCGIVLTNGGTGGGLDLLGVFLAKKFSFFSVGKMNISFNAVLYLFCAIVFNVSTALYSILYVIAFSISVDRFHYQNIEVELMIFTHHPELADVIMKKYVRGVTEWSGKGSYTNNETNVLVSIVAKSEVEHVKKDVLAVDPEAFIVIHEQTRVTGGYEKRLDI